MPVIKKQQTLIDFATQWTGSAENVFAVAIANGLNITDEMVPGAKLVVPGITDTKAAKFYNGSKNDITTNMTQILIILSNLGVGFWRVEDDNVIQ